MKIRLTGAALVAITVPALAAAAPISPTVRVEGASANVVPPMPFAVENTATAVVRVADSGDADAVIVPARSATAQLAGVTSSLGLLLGFDIFDFGGPSSFVTQIGRDKTPASFSPSWRLKVNHKVTSTGSDATALTARDTVLWSFGSAFDEPELDLRVNKRYLVPGTPVQARVVAYDNDGVATPAAGAAIRFAGATKTADPKGVATFAPTRDGGYWMSATRKGSVRSQRQLVCVRPPVAGNLCSAVTFPKPAGRVTAPGVITGTVAGVVPANRVTATLAKVVGSKCRFLRADRRTFSPARACDNPVTIPLAVSATGAWTLRIASKQAGATGRLSAGTYRVSSRMTVGTRREARATPGVNTVSFTVLAAGVYG